MECGRTRCCYWLHSFLFHWLSISLNGRRREPGPNGGRKLRERFNFPRPYCLPGHVRKLQAHGRGLPRSRGFSSARSPHYEAAGAFSNAEHGSLLIHFVSIPPCCFWASEVRGLWLIVSGSRLWISRT
jgi:hypothetical protein